MITYIHVNQHVIKANAKLADSKQHEPPLTIKDYKQNRKAFRVRILGPSEVVYSPDCPLSCGAKVWIETKSAVETE